MHIFEELVEPTVVTHSLICKLDPNHSHASLIVVRGASLLQVYSILPAPHGYTIPNSCARLIESVSPLHPTSKDKRKYLKLEAQWPMDGHLTGIEILPREGKIMFALSFRYAKVVVLEWIANKKQFQPTSLHFYENQITESNFRDFSFPAKLLVEPKGQCLSLWYQSDCFSILMFQDPDFPEDQLTGSILLNSTNLEPGSRNIIDMKYLSKYNGPTLGVLFQKNPTWTGDLPLHKDTVSFHIISVDTERKSSTTIFSLEKLPYDINQLIPLGSPLLGCLLVGSNVLAYVEANGRIISYSVNKFAQKCSNMVFTDYSDLNIDLAGSKVAHIPDTSHCVVVTASGEIYTLDFSIDGFKVFGLSIEKYLIPLSLPNPSSITVDSQNIFISSNGGSVLLSYRLEHDVTAQEADQDAAEAMEDEFDDVYVQEAGPTSLVLEFSDALLSIGPITGQTVIDGASIDEASTLCLSFGTGQSSGVACMQRGLWPKRTFSSLSKFSRFWAAGSYVLGTSSASSRSYLYVWPSLEEVKRDFQTDVFTLGFSRLRDGFWHIHSTGFVIYDSKFKVIKRVAFEKKCRSALIQGNYALICQADSHDLSLYSLHGAGYQYEQQVIGQSNRYYLHGDNIVFANAGEVTFTTTHDPVQQHSVNFRDLPSNAKDSKTEALEEDLKADISSIAVCYLGDHIDKLLVLAIIIEDVLTLYDFKTLAKVYTAPSLADLNIHPVDLGNISALVVGGTSPFILMKGHKTPIRHRPIRTNCVLCAASLGENLLFTDSRKRLELISLDKDWDYLSLNWPVTTANVGETITCIAYNDTAEVLLVSTLVPTERPVEDEGAEDDKMQEDSEGATNDAEDGTADQLPRCSTFNSFIKVINPETLRITDTVALGNEAVLCMKSVKLEVAENTDHYKEFLAIGTSILLDEDSVSNGHFYLYSIAEIVPDKDRPEVRHKVKAVSKELVAGAVTCLCEVMGKLAVAQGQRLLMRGVQEDHTIEPIAFCDLEIFASDIKSVRNLIIAGDLYRSTWLVNYGNEPNRLDVLGRDTDPSDGVVATEGLSSEIRQDLNMVSSDREGRIKILQYDPDNIHSMGGPKLVLQSQLYIGTVINTMSLVYGKHKDLGVIGGTSYGGVVSVMPLSEQDYRAFYVVTQQIMDREQPFACLNLRAHLNMRCEQGQTPAIYGPCAQTFWQLSRSNQLAYSRKLGRRGLDDVFNALSDDPLDYF